MKKILLIIFIVLLFIAIFFFLRDPKYIISDIYYFNNNFVPIKYLDQNFNSLKGKNFLIDWFSFNNHKKKFLQKFPEVESVKIYLKFPNTLKIFVKEKDPSFLIICKKKNFVISEDGFVLNFLNNQASITNLNKILIIKGLNSDIIKGNLLDANLLNEIKIISNYLKINFPLTSFQILFENDQIVILKDDLVPIKIGSITNLNTKIINLKKILTFLPEAKQKNIMYLDLRIPDRVIIKYNFLYENK